MNDHEEKLDKLKSDRKETENESLLFLLNHAAKTASGSDAEQAAQLRDRMKKHHEFVGDKSDKGLTGQGGTGMGYQSKPDPSTKHSDH